MGEKRVSPMISGGFPREIARYCIGCQNKGGFAPPSQKDRMMELVSKGISIPKAVLFQAKVFYDEEMPLDGTQVHFLPEPKGPCTWFLRGAYMCKGSCKLPFRALTLVSADEGSSLYSTLTEVGIVEVEIKEVTRKQMAQCRYRPGSPEWKVVEYLRSMSDLIGYRRLD